jgi:hypothetical protein
MTMRNKKSVTFDVISKEVMFNPKTTGIQRFKMLVPTKTRSVNNNAVYGPWKKPKGRYIHPHDPSRPHFQKYVLNKNGNPQRTEDIGFRLENLMFYQNKLKKM